MAVASTISIIESDSSDDDNSEANDGGRKIFYISPSNNVNNMSVLEKDLKELLNSDRHTKLFTDEFNSDYNKFLDKPRLVSFLNIFMLACIKYPFMSPEFKSFLNQDNVDKCWKIIWQNFKLSHMKFQFTNKHEPKYLNKEKKITEQNNHTLKHSWFPSATTRILHM